MENRTKMIQKEKNLLLRELCTRLPYGVHIRIETSLETGKDGYDGPLESIDLGYNIFNGYSVMPESVKPYLRPLSSMTEKEKKEYDEFYPLSPRDLMLPHIALQMFDWLNAHHFDYRGLIEMGLALPAPEEMYNN